MSGHELTSEGQGGSTEVARVVIDRTLVTSWVARGRVAADRHGLTVAAEIEIPAGRFLSDLSFNLGPNREQRP